MRSLRYAAALALLFLAGCETVPTQERAHLCRTVDWFEYGRNDGILGLPLGERSGLFADCRRFGYPPDVAAYQAGRADGLVTYCTLESGYRAGREGRRYHDVCPPDLEIAFLQGYREGRRARETRYGPYWAPGAPLVHYPHRRYDRDRDRDDDDDRPDTGDREQIREPRGGKPIDEFRRDRKADRDEPERREPERREPEQPEREPQMPDTDRSETIWPDTRDDSEDDSDRGGGDDGDDRDVEIIEREAPDDEPAELLRESDEGG